MKKKTTRKRPSYKKAVERACKECIYDPKEPGGWREQVTACTSPKCPLYDVRPTTTKRSAKKV